MTGKERRLNNKGQYSEGNWHKKKALPPADTDPEVCPRCGESSELAKIKGCIVCLVCHFKQDCNGF